MGLGLQRNPYGAIRAGPERVSPGIGRPLRPWQSRPGSFPRVYEPQALSSNVGNDASVCQRRQIFNSLGRWPAGRQFHEVDGIAKRVIPAEPDRAAEPDLAAAVDEGCINLV